jgi:uncharacterized membrane protein YhaH (DUF805 family)
MDVDRLSTGEKIAGISAILLFIFMFFDWFTVDVSGGDGLFTAASAGGSAWDALDVIPIFLMLAIVAAIAVAVVRLADAVFEPPISVNAVVSVLGALAVLLILYRIIDPPGETGSVQGLSVDISPAVGIFLGLIAAAGIAYGGYKAMQEEGATFADVGDRLSGGGSSGAGGPPQQPPAPTPPPPPPPPSSERGGPPPQ